MFPSFKVTKGDQLVQFHALASFKQARKGQRLFTLSIVLTIADEEHIFLGPFHVVRCKYRNESVPLASRRRLHINIGSLTFVSDFAAIGATNGSLVDQRGDGENIDRSDLSPYCDRLARGTPRH
jgi:hypothetical protein